MSTTKAFRGFIPVRKKGSNYNSEGVEVLPITSGGLCSNNVFTGDLVVIQGRTLLRFNHLLLPLSSRLACLLVVSM